MSLPTLLSRYRSLITAGLTEVLRGEGLLYTILRYHVGLEDEHGSASSHMGKLLRPNLVLFTAEQLGGELNQALPAALGLELIHNFSLIHDDVQDGDRTRRGCPTVWSRYGVAQAINAGDLMQALAITKALHAGKDAVKKLLEATIEMIEGQGLDLDVEEKAVGVEPYLEMIDKKTGSLIRCAFRLGAVIAAAPTEVEEALAEAGQELGRAFQIRDDLLGVWGDGAITGKPQGSDIRCKKKTLPAAIALSAVSGTDRTALERIYNKKTLTDEDVARVIEIMDKAGVHQVGEQMVIEHLSRAREWLAQVPFSKAGMQEMEELMEYLAEREQ